LDRITTFESLGKDPFFFELIDVRNVGEFIMRGVYVMDENSSDIDEIKDGQRFLELFESGLNRFCVTEDAHVEEPLKVFLEAILAVAADAFGKTRYRGIQIFRNFSVGSALKATDDITSMQSNTDLMMIEFHVLSLHLLQLSPSQY
jgi:hypothetical protein